jgi:hypothetical protein
LSDVGERDDGDDAGTPFARPTYELFAERIATLTGAQR